MKARSAPRRAAAPSGRERAGRGRGGGRGRPGACRRREEEKEEEEEGREEGSASRSAARHRREGAAPGAGSPGGAAPVRGRAAPGGAGRGAASGYGGPPPQGRRAGRDWVAAPPGDDSRQLRGRGRGRPLPCGAPGLSTEPRGSGSIPHPQRPDCHPTSYLYSCLIAAPHPTGTVSPSTPLIPPPPILPLHLQSPQGNPPLHSSYTPSCAHQHQKTPLQGHLGGGGSQGSGSQEALYVTFSCEEEEGHRGREGNNTCLRVACMVLHPYLYIYSCL